MKDSSQQIEREIDMLADGGAALMSLMSVEIHDTCTRLDIDYVLFFTREGITFRKYFDTFARAAGWSIKSEIFHASRLSTYSASLFSDGVEGLMRFFSQYSNANWEQTLKSLNAWPPSREIAGLISASGSAHATGTKLFNVFQQQERLAQWLQNLACSRRRGLIEYIEHFHPWLLGVGTALVVDIGWRGTIQDNLALVIPSTKLHGLYLGLFPYLNPQPTNVSKMALLFNDNEENQNIEGKSVFSVEYLFSAPVGSIIGYEQGIPQSAAPENHEENAYALTFQEVVQARAESLGGKYTEALRAAVQDELISTWKNEASHFWENAQRMSPALFDALRSHRHEETFGVGTTVHLDSVLSFRSLTKATYSPTARMLFAQHASGIPRNLRKIVPLSWWVRVWFILHDGLEGLRDLLRSRRQS